MKFSVPTLAVAVCVGAVLGQNQENEPFNFNQYKDLKFYVTHRGGLIIPGKIIRGGDASCVTTSFEENRDGNFSFVVDFTEQKRPARISHLAYPLEDGFAFIALSGDLVAVKVLETDYSNYAIVTYTYGARNYPVVLATNRMANSIIRQRFMEITGGTLVSLEVIDNQVCQRD